jgi:DNA ligase-4
MTDGTVEEPASLKIPTTPEGFEPKLEVTEDIDPELADWFQVDAKPDVAEDSETEDESDADSNNDDVKEEDADVDEWFQVPEVPRSPAVKPLHDNVRDMMDGIAVIHWSFRQSRTTLHSQPQVGVSSFMCLPVTMASGHGNGGRRPSEGI